MQFRGLTQVFVKVFKIFGSVQIRGLTQVFVKLFNTCGNLQTSGTIVVTSLPSGANGFILPSLPSGISTILESCKLINAGSEKIVSFNFIFVTFRSKFRKSLVIEELFSVADAPATGVPVADVTPLGEEETKVGTGAVDGFIKKI